MKKLILIALSFFAFVACKTQQASVDSAQTSSVELASSEVALPKDPNLIHVQAHCTSCHSAKMITMNRFTREGWKEKIEWMQKTQGLWDLGEAEPLVLDYLEKHFSPAPQTSRRKNLEGIEWYELE